MRTRFSGLTGAGAMVAVGAVLAVVVMVRPTAGQQAPAYRAPRTADGKPNLNGIWQSLTTADWNIQDHAASMGPVVALGAIGAVPPGQGIVEGNDIPYLPAAATQKKQNADKWLTLDPEVKCYLPGVPRAMYQPFPFQIVQTPTAILMGFEFASAVRTVLMGSAKPSPVDTWMGHSVGHWEGETLVVDVTSQVDTTWFDRSGNFHSDALHVVERYTPISADAIRYEATIEDPKTFSRPWKVSFPLYRRLEKNVQLLEFKCVEFVEELMYGHLRKKTTN